MNIPRVLLTIFAIVLALLFLATLFPGTAVHDLLTFDTDDAAEEAEDDLEEIAIALSRYHTRTGTFPTTEQGLQALVTRPSILPIPANWTQKLEHLWDDPWDHPYVYEYDPTANPGDQINLYSLGADGKESDDDIESEIDL